MRSSRVLFHLWASVQSKWTRNRYREALEHHPRIAVLTSVFVELSPEDPVTRRTFTVVPKGEADKMLILLAIKFSGKGRVHGPKVPDLLRS